MTSIPIACEIPCAYKPDTNTPQMIVITGGPGAGKTAVLEMLKKMLCQHVLVLPEAASIVFGGGFWRLNTTVSRRAAQRAIFHVQRELEDILLNEKIWSTGLCDRGSLDTLAYWPSEERDFFNSFNTTFEKEYLRYRAVIHLRCPSDSMGYNHQNPLRTETAQEAQLIDNRIFEIWSKHPNYKPIPAYQNFTQKFDATFEIVKDLIPDCCRQTVHKA
jgi:hypothetical protein